MKHIIRTLLLACCCMQAQAQAPWKPDTELEKQLQQSNHVHRIMKANLAHAGLTRWEKKKVLKSRVLPLAEDFGALIIGKTKCERYKKRNAIIRV